MECVENKITFDELKNYWFKWFPEFQDIDELEDLLKWVSDIDDSSVESFIERYEDEELISLDELFTKKKSNILEEVAEEVKSEVVFSNLYKPIFNYFADECYEKIEKSGIIENPKSFFGKFLQDECKELLEFSQRTLILDVNMARSNKRLAGETKELRFKYYVDTLLNSEKYLRVLFGKYKHLYNILITRCKWNFKYIEDVINYFKENLNDIKAKILNTKEDVKIRNISVSLGDSHRQGRTVSIIELDNNEKVVYKPRSFNLENGFNKFIDYLNSKGKKENSELYKMKVVSREDYGFSEFIKYDECKDEEDVKLFYYRTGKLLGALFALNAKDIHHENIIAKGNQPIVIDLEALFHSDVILEDKELFESTEVAQEIVNSSVYSIGFLPQKIFNPYEQQGSNYIDVSAFGSDEKQVAPFKSYKIINANTDEMKIEKVDSIIETESNTPKVNGEIRKSENYIEQIKEGFLEIYDILMNNKEEAINVIQSIFRGMRNRFILRPTYEYGQLMHTSYHPDFMRYKVNRYILLHRLGVNIEKKYLKVIKSEMNDILFGDVPYFSCQIDSREIKNSKDESIDMILDKSPLDKVIMKIKNLSNADRNTQIHFIDMSFLAKTTNTCKDETVVKFSKKVDEKTIDQERIIDLAKKIGKFIIEKSITGETKEGIDRTWISTVLLGKDECSWSLEPAGNNLYDGNTGIALFLAYLGEVTKEDIFTNTAIQAMESVASEVEKLNTKYPLLIGPYNGISGYFYGLFQMYNITGEKRFLSIIKDKIDIFYSLIDKDRNIDVISGASGTLGVFLNMYNNCDDDELKKHFLKIAMLCYEHIKNSKVSISEDSIAWGEGGIYVPCSGFAHGNSGIIAYLMKLYAITKDDEILDIVRKGLNYERSLYSMEHRNWYSSIEKHNMGLAWCHGAPGILLSRLILKDCGYNDEFIDKEIDIALETTIKQGFGNNPCFCHGDLGNLSIVEYAAKVLNKPELKKNCIGTFNQIFNDVVSERWNKGVSCGTENMGLMIGLACFGYGILMKNNNVQIPQILWFE